MQRGDDNYVLLIMDKARMRRGEAGSGGGAIVRSPKAAEIKRQQRKYFKLKKIGFLPSSEFKVLRQTEGNLKY
jgi:hypothetical protein